MKKTKDLLLSFILPRKMYKYHDMKGLYSVLIFLISMMILLFSVNITAEKHMTKVIQTIDFENNQYYPTSGYNGLPKYKIVQAKSSGGLYLDVEEASSTGGTDNFRGVYNIVIKNGKTGCENETVYLTVLFLEDLDPFASENPTFTIDKDFFDLEGYLNQEIKEGESHILYVFTKKAYYYMFNFGKIKNDSGEYVDNSNIRTDAYQLNDDGSYKYYLPKDASELVVNEFGDYDVSKWTVLTTEGETETIDINGESVTVSSTRKRNENIRFAISQGEYLYSNVDYEKINAENDYVNVSRDVMAFLKGDYKLMVEADANIQKNMYAFFALLINVIFPLFWVLVTWLLSRKFVMNKFREYYAIAAIIYLVSSFLGAILGFFMSFDRLILIIVVFELIYYIIATFRINTDPSLLDAAKEENNNDDGDPSNGSGKKVESPKLQFRKVSSSDAYQVE